MNTEQLFLAQKKHSLYWRTASIAERKEGLKKLAIKIKAQQKQICSALYADFAKPEMEVLMTEIYPVLQEIQFVLKKLDQWVKPTKAPSPPLLAGARSSIYYEPKGTVLVIAPWNYPFNLSLIPVISALAAGNCVILKPSELTPKTSALVAEILSDIFPENQVLTIQGGKEVSTQLLALPFDHIFFTGSTAVGKIVMSAASHHLSEVTLELGGKSPTIIDETADLDIAAQKLVWGKFVNAGQTCIAPDYLLVQANIYAALMDEIKKKIKALYQNPNQDLAQVISSTHLQRLSQIFNEALEKGSRLIIGGQFDFQKNTLSPTALEVTALETRIMNEEIFGPLLPIIKFHELKEAIEFINQKPKPLALYMFSRSKENIQYVLKATTAGGVCINETLLHFANHHLPFGGIGESGTGNYHGYNGFKTFSHGKSVLRQSFMGRLMAMIYPPYVPWKLKLAKFLIRWGI